MNIVTKDNTFNRILKGIKENLSHSKRWSAGDLCKSLDNFEDDQGYKFIQTYKNYNFLLKILLQFWISHIQYKQINEMEKFVDKLSEHGLLTRDNFSKIQQQIDPRKLTDALIMFKKSGFDKKLTELGIQLDLSKYGNPDEVVRGIGILNNEKLLTKENLQVLNNPYHPRDAALALVALKKHNIEITKTHISYLSKEPNLYVLTAIIIANNGTIFKPHQNKTKPKGLANITNHYTPDDNTSHDLSPGNKKQTISPKK